MTNTQTPHATVRDARTEGPDNEILGRVDLDTYLEYCDSAGITSDDYEGVNGGIVDGADYGYPGHAIYMTVEVV
jgi:hypothetical protein